jgi:hypothetical protein
LKEEIAMSTPMNQNEDTQKQDLEPQQLPSDPASAPSASEETDRDYGEGMRGLLHQRQQIEQQQQ